MTKRIEAAVFDVDGMILDTREFIFQAYEHTLALHGHEVPPRQVIAKEIGRSLPDCYLAFAPEGENSALCETHHSFQDLKLDLITAYEGLHKMLDILKEAGLKMGVFSSRKGNLIQSLVNTGVDSYFSSIIQGDQVTKHKPHPEGLFKVLNDLEVSTENAVMLGDSPVDIGAGKAANVALTIGITHGFDTREDLAASNPDYIVDGLLEIPSIVL